jgi:hypothetical protein
MKRRRRRLWQVNLWLNYLSKVRDHRGWKYSKKTFNKRPKTNHAHFHNHAPFGRLSLFPFLSSHLSYCIIFNRVSLNIKKHYFFTLKTISFCHPLVHIIIIIINLIACNVIVVLRSNRWDWIVLSILCQTQQQ